MAAGWRITEQEHSSRALCACLDLIAPLVSAVITTPADPSAVKGHTKSDAERFSYSALSALICAAQIKTAWALHGSHETQVCRAESFHCFWPCTVARSELPTFIAHSYVCAGCVSSMHLLPQHPLFDISYVHICNAATVSQFNVAT